METDFSIPNFYVVLLIIPPIIFLFYGFIYQKQFARELPMAVWDEDRSSVSRTLTDMMEQNENIHFTHVVFSNAEIEQLMKEGKIFGAVHFPKIWKLMPRKIISRISHCIPMALTLFLQNDL